MVLTASCCIAQVSFELMIPSASASQVLGLCYCAWHSLKLFFMYVSKQIRIDGEGSRGGKKARLREALVKWQGARRSRGECSERDLQWNLDRVAELGGRERPWPGHLGSERQSSRESAQPSRFTGAVSPIARLCMCSQPAKQHSYPSELPSVPFRGSLR